jgi:UDP-N-acetylmuramate--alanine ligase
MSETRSIAIAGTHGKTTTTAMTVQILKAAGADPWFAVGGEMDAFGGVAGIGRGSWLVAEADESDGTLAWYAPAVAAVTNIDFDHMEHFRDEREFHEVFERFCSRTRGPVLFGRDDAVATRIAGSRPGAAGFGFDPASDIRAEHWAPEGAGQRFDLIVDGLPAGNVFLPVPGRYNALNALGAIAAARAAGVSPEVSGRALGKFRPVRRRMECVHAGAVSVFTDYAHHPAEIRALLGAVLDLRSRAGPGKLSVVFQPHRFTRTRALGEQFPAAFDGADRVVLAPVYAASEAPLEGGRSEDLLVRMERHGRYPVELAASLDDAWARGTRDLRSGDRLLLVGAGDIERLAERAAAEGPSRWP